MKRNIIVSVCGIVLGAVMGLTFTACDNDKVLDESSIVATEETTEMTTEVEETTETEVETETEAEAEEKTAAETAAETVVETVVETEVETEGTEPTEINENFSEAAQ